MRALRKEWLFAAIVALLAYAVLELGSWALLSRLDPIYLRADIARLVAGVRDDETDSYNRWLRDPLLGWDFRPGWRQHFGGTNGGWTVSIANDGARLDPDFVDAQPEIAAYGDSFTLCGEVNDDQSWEHYLSLRRGRYVANFAVSGYGTDQALLKYEIKHAGRSPQPAIVILAISEENIQRIVNRYRQFYHPTMAPFGFKPRFILDDGRLQLIGQALGDAEAVRTTLPASIAASEPGDAWRVWQVDLAWPYSLRLAKLAPVIIADRFGTAFPGLGILPQDLWHDGSTTSLMRALIHAFVATAKVRRSLPVILFIPLVPEPWSPPGYTQFVTELRHDPVASEALVLDVAEAKFDRERFNVRPHDGHASPYGNQVIAAQLAGALPPWLEQRAGQAHDP